jgi:hypothetical protein
MIKKLLVILFVVSFINAPVNAKNNKDSSLPPGLQKKYQKGKPLPPGWQKKLSKGDILDNSIYVRGKVVVPLGSDGVISINIEGTILKLHEKTRKIIDIF